jgi:Ras family protein
MRAGKSSISVRFVENDWSATYEPTIENTYLHNLNHNGRDYVCELVDTSGQVR